MLSLHNQPKAIKFLFWFFILIPTLCFVVATIAYFSYLFWPHDISSATSFPINSQATHLTISAHGVKDSPENWSDNLLEPILLRSPMQSQYISLDWRPFSDNPLMCSVNAEKIGQAIAVRIANETQVKSIHAIGHSCGSFVIYSLCQSIKKSHPSIKIQSTYLDPVSIYAGVFWDYGVKHFGDCADFSDAYIDTGDSVPGSNSALKNAVTFDVTQARIEAKSDEPPHNWPPQFYIKSLTTGTLPLLHEGNIEDKDFIKGILIPLT